MKKQIVWFGVAAGIIIVVYSMITFLGVGDFSQLTPREIKILEGFGYLRYVILIVGVLLGMRAVARASSEPIGYWKAVGTGALVGCVAAVFVGLMEWGYLQFMNPGFYDQYFDSYIQRLQADGAAAEKIEQVRAQAEQFAFMRSPVLSGIFYFFETTVVGGIVALLGGAFFRGKK